MIGLKRNTVKIIPYQIVWEEAYQKAAKDLRQWLTDEIVAIEHIGSTAIKGMAAKPIIDIAVAIDDLSKINTIRPILLLHAFEDRGEGRGGYLFVKREGELTTHHIHIVRSLGNKWSDYLAFKKKLNTDEQLKRDYLNYKKYLAQKYPADRTNYTTLKGKLIDKIFRLINDERLIRVTYELANESAKNGFEPFGAILVKNEVIVYSSQDKSIVYSDPTGHAELVVISEYCRKNELISLEEYTLYCNVEPCIMCSGAIHWSKIKRVVFGVYQKSLQAISKGKNKPSCEQLINIGSEKVEIEGGVLEEEGIAILNKYPFQSKQIKHQAYLAKKKN